MKSSLRPLGRAACWLLAFSLAYLPVHDLAAAGQPASPSLTLDWILDPEKSRAFQSPSCLWLSDETLLIADNRRPAGERSLERLDPRTLERRPAGDHERILQGWQALLGEAAPKSVTFPAAAAADGRTLLYLQGGDLFLVDLEGGSVRRLTNTTADEISPRFSPDGRWLAYVRDNDLFAAEVATGRERRLTRDGSATRLNGTLSWVYWEEIMDRSDLAYWWSPDSSAILYLQSDEAAVAEFALVDHEPPTPSVRLQRYPKAGGVNPAVRAGIVELENARTRWIDFGRDPRDGAIEYIARGGWLPRGEAAVQTLNRAQNRLKLWIVPRAGGGPRRAHAGSCGAWINLHHDLHFLPDGERFVWVSETSGFRHLHLHSLAGGPAAAITSGEWVLRNGGGQAPWSGAVAWIDAAGAQVYYHAARPSPLGLQLFRSPLAGGPPLQLTEGEGTHRTSVSPRGSFFVDFYSRSGVPPRVTLHRIDGTMLHVIQPSASELAAFALVLPELLTVSAGDGTPLSARLLLPPALDASRRHPAIVYVYGGPGAPAVNDRWDGFFYLWGQVLASRGFVVFAVDPRSSLDQGMAKEATAARRFYGEGEHRDILAGVRHLKGLPYVDPERVGIWGWSGGGSSTLYAMTRSREFAAGIAVAGVTDFRYYDTIYTERYMGKPSENEEGYRASAPAHRAADLHGRLLLVHGTADDNVHPQNALRFADELITAGKQFDFMLYPRADHGISRPAARRHLFQLMLDFWERNLKTAEERAAAIAREAVPVRVRF
jgi:dipeptidyl-peptidase-4